MFANFPSIFFLNEEDSVCKRLSTTQTKASIYMLFCIFLKEKPETPVLQNILSDSKINGSFIEITMLFGGTLWTSFYSGHACDLVLGI